MIEFTLTFSLFLFNFIFLYLHPFCPVLYHYNVIFGCFLSFCSISISQSTCLPVSVFASFNQSGSQYASQPVNKPSRPSEPFTKEFTLYILFSVPKHRLGSIQSPPVKNTVFLVTVKLFCIASLRLHYQYKPKLYYRHRPVKPVGQAQVPYCSVPPLRQMLSTSDARQVRDVSSDTGICLEVEFAITRLNVEHLVEPAAYVWNVHRQVFEHRYNSWCILKKLHHQY